MRRVLAGLAVAAVLAAGQPAPAQAAARCGSYISSSRTTFGSEVPVGVAYCTGGGRWYRVVVLCAGGLWLHGPRVRSGLSIRQCWPFWPAVYRARVQIL